MFESDKRFLFGFDAKGSTLVCQVWPTKHDRDHPDTIKRRFISAAFMMVVSPLFVAAFGAPHLLANYTLVEILGLRYAEQAKGREMCCVGTGTELECRVRPPW